MSSILTVSQLNKYMHSKIQSDAKLKGVAVKGELSAYTVNAHLGHAFFTLKDEDSILKGVMYASSVKRLRFAPEKGMSILAVGNITVYERDGIYQIVASELQPLGVGAVSLGLEQLKRKLTEQGVFDASKKKKIPETPKKIALVTSTTGAALQDFLKIIRPRYPLVKLQVFETLVQGDSAPDLICDALARADSCGADTIILTRGGGANENLMAFNTEKVALAVYNCKTPIISAVGHEVDTTFSDYAADLRAATPSHAVELAVPDIAVIKNKLAALTASLDNAYKAVTADRQRRLENLSQRLTSASPENTVKALSKANDVLFDRLQRAGKRVIESKCAEIEKLSSQIEALSPFAILGRGYSIALKDGSPVSSAAALSEGDELQLILADGTANIKIIKVN